MCCSPISVPDRRLVPAQLRDPRVGDPPDVDHARIVGRAMIFRLTTSQGRRRRYGLAGGAAIVWSLGLVRFVVTDRLTTDHWVLPLVLLAAVLALGAALVAAMAPLVVVSDDVLASRYGPRRITIPCSEITDIELRERGIARRVVVRHGGGHTVLPVPLTGGSLLGPGPDPELEHKVELLRGWWRERSAS
jgi:hypothetical protein